MGRGDGNPARGVAAVISVGTEYAAQPWEGLAERVALSDVWVRGGGQERGSFGRGLDVGLSSLRSYFRRNRGTSAGRRERYAVYA
jgi:hypothetical protein